MLHCQLCWSTQRCVAEPSATAISQKLCSEVLGSSFCSCTIPRYDSRQHPDCSTMEPQLQAYALELSATLVQDVSLGHGGSVWDSAPVLCGCLRSYCSPEGSQQPRVLELGAGTGLCGVVAAALGAEATLTDKPAYVPLLQANAGWAAAQGYSCTAAALSFGCNLKKALPDAIKRPFDVVLLSDVLTACGDEVGLYPLVKTLCDLAKTNPNLIILCAGKSRAGFEERWPLLMEEGGFTVQELVRLAPWMPPSGQDTACGPRSDINQQQAATQPEQLDQGGRAGQDSTQTDNTTAFLGSSASQATTAMAIPHGHYLQRESSCGVPLDVIVHIARLRPDR